MCLQDLQIARATKAYRRAVLPANPGTFVLQGNPRRFALILPAAWAGVQGWALGYIPSVTNSDAMFITGSGVGPTGVSDLFLGAVILKLTDIGDALLQPLGCTQLSGTANIGPVTEILFDGELPQLQV